jgi:hypothetical protein
MGDHSVSFQQLPTVERIRAYRDLAEQARAKAAQVSDADARESFLMLSRGWDQLADTVERDFRGNGPE